MTYDRDTLRKTLIRHEGLRLKPYWDTATPPRATVGVGRNLTDRGLTQEEALFLLENDITGCEADLDAAEPGWRDHPEPVQRALVELTFNLGIGGWLKFRNTRQMLVERAYVAAARNLKLSKWYRQVGRNRGDYIAGLIAGAAEMDREVVA
jgi:lysozyme